MLLLRGLLQWHRNQIFQYLCPAASSHAKSKFHPFTYFSLQSLHISSYKVPGHPRCLLCIHLLLARGRPHQEDKLQDPASSSTDEEAAPIRQRRSRREQSLHMGREWPWVKLGLHGLRQIFLSTKSKNTEPFLLLVPALVPLSTHTPLPSLP